MATPKLAQAIASGDIDKAWNLLRSCKGSNLRKLIQAGSNQAIVEAASRPGASVLVYALVCNKANYATRNHTPLRLAVAGADLATIHILLRQCYAKHPPLVDKAGAFPADILNLAIENCPEEVTTAMVETFRAGFDNDSLLAAVSARKAALVHALLEAGAMPQDACERDRLAQVAFKAGAGIQSDLRDHGLLSRVEIREQRERALRASALRLAMTALPKQTEVGVWF